MKTIIIVNDIPLHSYHSHLNALLKKIDYRTFTLPVTKFELITGVQGVLWDEYEYALQDNDFDFYIISLTLNDVLDETELNMLGKYTSNPNTYCVFASSLKQVLKNENIIDFINQPTVK